jgi:hypothetical protein
VLSDLDQMGTLVKKGLIQEKAFLDVYWNTVISCYEVLKDEKDVFGPSASMIEYSKQEEHVVQRYPKLLRE